MSKEKEFDIDVTRIGTGHRTIPVTANSLEEAQEKALDEAGDHIFSDKSSEYELTDAGFDSVSTAHIPKNYLSDEAIEAISALPPAYMDTDPEIGETIVSVDSLRTLVTYSFMQEKFSSCSLESELHKELEKLLNDLHKHDYFIIIHPKT